jgi:hypothetical protein
MPIPMSFILSITFFFLTIDSLLGQVGSSQDSLIVNYEQNGRWLDRLETKNTVDRLSAIRARILSDTAIYVRRAFADRIKIDDQYKNEKRIQGDCKPVLVFGYQPVYIDNQTSVSTIKELADLLTTRNVRDIRIMRGQNATAIYGSKASCGVFVFDLRRKQIERKVKTMKLE